MKPASHLKELSDDEIEAIRKLSFGNIEMETYLIAGALVAKNIDIVDVQSEDELK